MNKKVLLSIIPVVVIGMYAYYTYFSKTVDNDISKITIGYQKTSLYRHVFLAKEKNFFQEYGIEVELKPFVSSNRMMEAMLSGHIDVMGLSNFQVALNVETKTPGEFRFINFLVWKEKSFPDYIITHKDSNITSIKDIENHTIGLHPGSAVKAFAKVIFEKFDVNQSLVKTISLKPSVMQSAILSKSIDALYCMDPVATSLIQSGECKILISNPMQYIFKAPTPIAGTIVSKRILNDGKINKLKKALDKAIEYLRQGHDIEAADAIAKYTPITRKLALNMNISEYWMLHEVDINRTQSLADNFFNYSIINKKIDMHKIIYNEK